MTEPGHPYAREDRGVESPAKRTIFGAFNWLIWAAIVVLIGYIVWTFVDPAGKPSNYPYTGMHLGADGGSTVLPGERAATAIEKLRPQCAAVDTLAFAGRSLGILVFYDMSLKGARGAMILLIDSVGNVSRVTFLTNMTKLARMFGSGQRHLRDLRPFSYAQHYSYEDLDTMAKRLESQLGNATPWDDNARGATREFREHVKNWYLRLEDGSLMLIESNDKAPRHQFG